jgi:SpoIID/LytB domain protein
MVPDFLPAKIDFSILTSQSAQGLRQPSGFSEVSARKDFDLVAWTKLPKKIRLKDEKGQIQELDFDEYLLGVLAGEMPARWPMEALKAQAVASRSYALSQMVHQALLAQNFDVHSTILDQVYRPPDHLSDALLERLKIAIKETQNLVITGASGKILKAYFHSNCGGSRLTPDQVWGPRADLVVRTQSCWKHPITKWDYSISKVKLQEKLRSYLETHLDLHFQGFSTLSFLSQAKEGSDPNLGANFKLSFEQAKGFERATAWWANLRFRFFSTAFAEPQFSKRLASLEVSNSLARQNGMSRIEISPATPSRSLKLSHQFSPQ